MKIPKITQLPSGSWFCRLTVDGERISITDPDRNVVEAKVMAIKAKLTSGSKSSTVTVGEALDNYIKHRNASISPGTLREYTQCRARAFGPIENKPCGKMTQESVQSFLNAYARDHSWKTVRNVAYLLIPALAAEGIHIDSKRLLLPPKQRTEVFIPDSAAVKALYAEVKGTCMELPFLLASQCGLRESEICALQRSDVTADSVRVTKASVRSSDGSYVLKQPKSFAGYRQAPVSDTLRTRLLEIGGDPQLTDLSPQDISHRWEHVCNRAGVQRFKFHALRHYFASQAFLAGIPLEYLAEIMGHGSTVMLRQVYLHTFPSERKAFSAQIASHMERSLLE